jgi:hypothetical protein
MEHSLHLAARHFVEGVSPTPSRKVIQKVHDALSAAGEDGDIDMDALDENLGAVEGADDDDAEDFDVGDVVGKALALVTQVGIVHITIDIVVI